jgi:hypothetical protein
MHFKKYNLFTPHQHGFLSGKSCTTNLLEYVDIITNGIENGESIDVLYTDFSKAFDTVPHDRLLLKLQAYGVTGNTVTWIRGFLTHRRQKVVMGAHCSSWIQVLSGEPQGSVLGPLLFLINVNDLPEKLANTCKLYAEDIKIIAPICNCCQTTTLQVDINKLCQWSQDWLVRLNFEKCSIMHF